MLDLQLKDKCKMAQEKSFENKIKDFLQKENVWFVKFFANAFTKKGIPDLLCCVNGFFVAVEVKAENGKPSDLQKWNIDKIRNCKGIAIILYPKQFESFKRLIKMLKEKNVSPAIFEMSPEDFNLLYKGGTKNV